MLRNLALVLALTLGSLNLLFVPQKAIAQTPLNKAVIESLRNRVRLIRQNQSPRLARRSDTMTLGDALATANASMAQLRFNDGSLARLGESAVFRFIPGTRNFGLSNGTALLLIPPGRGRTNVRTPNATAGIRGSGLFVRYIAETDTTLVGALTNSGIEVFNYNGSQNQELKAGHMAVVVKDRIEQVYEFDLETFYQTSELASGLDLMGTELENTPDEAIALVQVETTEALESQSPLTEEDVIENPSFIQLQASGSEEFPDVNVSLTDIERNYPQPESTLINRDFTLSGSNSNFRSLIEGGEIRSNQTPSQPTVPGSGGGNTGGQFPGGGNTGGQFPGGGNTGGQFPGGGNTGGQFPGGGATGGQFPGGGATGGQFPGAAGGNAP